MRRGKGGRIEIDFGSEAELNRIYEYIDLASAEVPDPHPGGRRPLGPWYK